MYTNAHVSATTHPMLHLIMTLMVNRRSTTLAFHKVVRQQYWSGIGKTTVVVVVAHSSSLSSDFVVELPEISNRVRIVP